MRPTVELASWRQVVKEVGEPCSPMAIADDTGLAIENVQQLVGRMQRRGEVARPKRRLYECA